MINLVVDFWVGDQAVLFPPSQKTQKIAGLEIRVPRDHHLAHRPVIQNLTVCVNGTIRLLHQAFQFQRKRAVNIKYNNTEHSALSLERD